MQFLNTMVLYTRLCTQKDTKFHSALSGLSQLSQMNKLIDATCIEILSPTNCANVSLECWVTVSGTRLQPHLVGLFLDCLSSSKDAKPPEAAGQSRDKVPAPPVFLRCHEAASRWRGWQFSRTKSEMKLYVGQQRSFDFITQTRWVFLSDKSFFSFRQPAQRLLERTVMEDSLYTRWPMPVRFCLWASFPYFKGNGKYSLTTEKFHSLF